MHKQVIISLFLYLVISPAKAALINGDFSDYSGWSGTIYDGTTTTTVDIAADPRFNLVTGGLRLSNNATYFEVLLFQTIIVPNNATFLNFDFNWSVTGPTGSGPDIDLVQASLVNSAGTLFNLLPAAADLTQSTFTSTANFDLSLFRGTQVTIEFLLGDGDFDEADTFTIDNVQIGTRSGGATPVPEPSSALILLFSAVLLIRRLSKLKV